MYEKFLYDKNTINSLNCKYFLFSRHKEEKEYSIVHKKAPCHEKFFCCLLRSGWVQVGF